MFWLNVATLSMQQVNDFAYYGGDSVLKCRECKRIGVPTREKRGLCFINVGAHFEDLKPKRSNIVTI